MTNDPNSEPAVERLHYDEELSEDAGGYTPPPERPPSQPVWRSLLLPGSIVVAALIVGGALFFAFSGYDDSDRPLPTVTTADTARATFEGYADALGLDTEEFSACLESEETVANIVGHLQTGASNGVGATPTFLINNKLILGAQPIEVFTEIIEAERTGGFEAVEDYSANIQALAQTSPPRFVILDEMPEMENLKFKEGDADAEIVIVEFSDFQCPFCQRFTFETLPLLEEQLGDDVAFAFAHFPIVDIHPNAGPAALAAECADLQGDFWRMHDLLFQNQAAWEDLP